MLVNDVTTSFNMAAKTKKLLYLGFGETIFPLCLTVSDKAYKILVKSSLLKIVCIAGLSIVLIIGINTRVIWYILCVCTLHVPRCLLFHSNVLMVLYIHNYNLVTCTVNVPCTAALYCYSL